MRHPRPNPSTVTLLLLLLPWLWMVSVEQRVGSVFLLSYHLLLACLPVSVTRAPSGSSLLLAACYHLPSPFPPPRPCFPSPDGSERLSNPSAPSALRRQVGRHSKPAGREPNYQPPSSPSSCASRTTSLLLLLPPCLFVLLLSVVLLLTARVGRPPLPPCLPHSSSSSSMAAVSSSFFSSSASCSSFPFSA